MNGLAWSQEDYDRGYADGKAAAEAGGPEPRLTMAVPNPYDFGAACGYIDTVRGKLL